MPKVSIIIPCYNIEPHISKCIDSLLVQSFPDFELLLINDGSTDATLKVIKEYASKDERIKVYSHENNGVSFTRNRGIKEAKGDMMVFIDGDDYVKSDFLERLLEGYEPLCLCISGMLLEKNQVYSKSGDFEMLTTTNDGLDKSVTIINLMASGYLNTPCCKLYERKLILKYNISFDEMVSYQEDLLFNLEYGKHIKFVKPIDYFGYFYVQHGDSSSKKYHQSFSHISQSFRLLIGFSKSSRDDEKIKVFLFQSVMMKIENIFHQSASTTPKQKKDELKEMYASDYFQYIAGYIFKAPVNLVLRLVLKSRNVELLVLYYKLLTLFRNGQ